MLKSDDCARVSKETAACESSMRALIQIVLQLYFDLYFALIQRNLPNCRFQEMTRKRNRVNY